ncbi:hypothetical protein IWQ60_000947, partial [Tieghemiomyces parasiticus]
EVRDEYITEIKEYMHGTIWPVAKPLVEATLYRRFLVGTLRVCNVTPLGNVYANAQVPPYLSYPLPSEENVKGVTIVGNEDSAAYRPGVEAAAGNNHESTKAFLPGAIRDFRPELLKINNAARPIKFDDIIYQDKANLALRFPQALLLGNMRYLDHLQRVLLGQLGNFGVMDILHQGSGIPTSHLQFMEIILNGVGDKDDEDDNINVIDSATTGAQAPGLGDDERRTAILVADRLNQPDHVGKIQSWYEAMSDAEACDLKGSGRYLGWEPRTDILKGLVQRCDKPEPASEFENNFPVYIGADNKLYFLTYDSMVTTEPTTLQ